MYEGMVTYLGTYSMDGPDVTVYPDYIRFGQNISPADLGELKFYKLSPTYLIMKSTAYLSEYDDIFVTDLTTLNWPMSIHSRWTA